jgi:BTB/POZ domain-containing protein KCTD9
MADNEPFISCSLHKTDDSSAEPPATRRKRITLQVSTTRFETLADTLQESGFFAALLSGRWSSQTELDGSIFVDADADLFVHILQYLRRGVMPVFFDEAKGHNYPLYSALLEEARYFQIPQLESWISEKKYLIAVRTVHSAEVLEGEGAVNLNSLANLGTDTFTEYRSTWVTEQVYVCPRRIVVHRGNPDSCGRQCRSAGPGEFVDENVLKIVAVKRQTYFRYEDCVDGR